MVFIFSQQKEGGSMMLFVLATARKKVQGKAEPVYPALGFSGGLEYEADDRGKL